MNPYGVSSDRNPELAPACVRELHARRNDQIAVFDADGTLWTNDVADDFTTWMIDEGHIDGSRWPDYMRIYRDDPPTGCEFLLTFYMGMTRAELAEKVDYYWLHHAKRDWIEEAVEALYVLDAKGYPVWIVSGTPTDFLLPLRTILPVAWVVGMDFQFDDDGRINGNVCGIPCAGAGKARKLLHLLGPRKITLAAGNGTLDEHMMDLAETAWAVYPNPAFEEVARTKGWEVLPRPADFVEEEKFLLED